MQGYQPEGPDRQGSPPPGGTVVVRGVPRDAQQSPCSIIFGHNVSVRQVCLLLSTPATQLIFSPEEAEDVAAKLQYYAKAARGEKPA